MLVCGPSSRGPLTGWPAGSLGEPQGGYGGCDPRPKRLQREALIRAPRTLLQTTRRGILIVDGSQATREAIAELLQDCDYTVYTADSMAQMVRICWAVTEPPEFAVLEFRLWDGPGDRAAAWLRTRWPNVFILYFSCSPPEYDEALRTALLVPATAVLCKPTSFEAILQAVVHAGSVAHGE
jgi:CheY-like chemotaxis protein